MTTVQLYLILFKIILKKYSSSGMYSTSPKDFN